LTKRPGQGTHSRILALEKQDGAKSITSNVVLESEFQLPML